MRKTFDVKKIYKIRMFYLFYIILVWVYY